jgi:hypothetical protein
MVDTDQSREMGLPERILRSRVMRGIFRLHMGASLVRSWSRDVQVPLGTSVHLFDYLLYRRTDRKEPFVEWVKNRKLLDP